MNSDNVTEAVRRALDLSPALPAPDAIVLAMTIGPPWFAMWMKDGARWHPELAPRGIVYFSEE